MRVTPKALLAAAAVMVVALTPSIADCATIHEEAPHHAWKLWAWIGLASIIAILFGEAMMGRR